MKCADQLLKPKDYDEMAIDFHIDRTYDSD